MRLGAAALTLTLALGFAGLASAEESGNWFTRLFTATPEKTEPANKIDVKTDPTKIPVSSSNNRIKQAKADLERRQEVCLKLREIAIANGDDDLQRKAEMLDQRAYDLYVAAKNQARTLDLPAADPAPKKGGR
jgi:hypothetical protein